MRGRGLDAHAAPGYLWGGGKEGARQPLLALVLGGHCWDAQLDRRSSGRGGEGGGPTLGEWGANLAPGVLGVKGPHGLRGQGLGGMVSCSH